MSPWTRGLRFFLPVLMLVSLLSCSGGGGSGSGNAITPSNHPPTVAFGNWIPSGTTTLTRYKSYTIAATASSPDLGVSISKYEWDFGDQSPIAATVVGTVNHAFSASGNLTLKVRATDSRATASGWVSQSISVDSSASPISVSFTDPASATTLMSGTDKGASITFTINVQNTGSGTISASGITFDSGDSGSTVGTLTNKGNGVWTIPVTYSIGAAGTRVFTPTVSVVDSQGVGSGSVAGPAITIKTVSGTLQAPSITITSPETPTSAAFTSKPVNLAFTLTDPQGAVVSYDVNWGDGTTNGLKSTTGDTTAGVAVSTSHAYADAFTSGTKNAIVTISATNGIKPADNKTVTFTVTFNTYPTAAITTPQASGTQGASILSAVQAASNYAGNESVDIVVIPLNGRLAFDGTSTLPGSGDAITYSWKFPGGVPSTSSDAHPGQVSFAGNAGVITPYLVEFSAIDSFERSSSAAAGAVSKNFRKWVVVDGVDTQLFKLSFMYRLKSDDNGISTLSTVTMADNGLGANVQIFQDGQSNTYAVQSQNQATVSIPVRSNLPFYIKIPSFGSDSFGYAMRIPNQPGLDPDLEAPAGNGSSSFAFENSSKPWNPSLAIVTAQGFAAETASADIRMLQGTTQLVPTKSPKQDTWLNRMSVPFNDSTKAIPWEHDADYIYTMNGIEAYQRFAEWPIALRSLPGSIISATDTASSTEGKSGDVGFVLDYPSYTSDSSKSKSFAAVDMQAFRAPKGSTDPYDLNVAGWDTTWANLSPTDLSSDYSDFYANAIYGDAGSTLLSGGLQGLSIPYDANDPDRVVLTSSTIRGFQPTRSVFAYSEYLWTKVWAWPLVLNHANLSFMDTYNLYAANPNVSYAPYSFFRYSNPTEWPKKLSSITPDGSAFDLTASGGGVFDPSHTPVGYASGTGPSSQAVGHFFWTAFTPSYNANVGSTITRTWLADSTGVPPKLFDSVTTQTLGSANRLASSAFGFVPPQDTVVDKRGRNADGTLNGSALGGYRVTWFNATKDDSGNPVPPDFWVIELEANGSKQHFMLPSNYPSASNGYATNPDSMPILTDARDTLTRPSDSKKIVAPGYCWFDVPFELRPAAGSTAKLTVFAVKSVIANHIGSLQGARALNRPEWIDAIKTVTANISIKSSAGTDLSYAHKIPFNYYWDIVVANGPTTMVAP